MRNLLGRTYRCPVTDVVGGLIDIFADSAVADVGAAAVGDAAVDVGAGAAADAAATAGVAGLADTGIAAGLDTGLGAAADAAATAGAVGGGVDALSATAGGAGAAADALPEVSVTASALPSAAATGGSAVTSALTGAGAGALIGASGAGGGGSGSATPTDPSGAPQQVNTTAHDALTGGSGAGSFLPATGDSSMSTLDPSTLSALGIDTSTGGDVTSGGSLLGGSSVGDSSADVLTDVQSGGVDMPGGGGSGGFGSDLESWLSHPKNVATLAGLGLSGAEALTKPKLPGAASTALNAAGPAVQQAQNIISSGGTATPIWSQQKASIDSQIDQEIQQQTQALQQAAANNGMGNQNSGIVQQQIQTMTANLNEQRQQLYLQAQQQNVNNAVSELTGGNQTLTSIANMQLAQQEQAQNQAKQTAQLSLQLASLAA